MTAYAETYYVEDYYTTTSTGESVTASADIAGFLGQVSAAASQEEPAPAEGTHEAVVSLTGPLGQVSSTTSHQGRTSATASLSGILGEIASSSLHFDTWRARPDGSSSDWSDRY